MADHLPLLAEWQRVTHQLLRALDEALAGLDLSPGEVNALACFGDRDAIAVRDLVAATGQRPSTMTGVLDRLERRGLAARRPHPDDRRSLEVALTPAGRRASAAVGQAFADAERRLPSRRVLRRTLADVDAALSVRPAAPAPG